MSIRRAAKFFLPSKNAVVIFVITCMIVPACLALVHISKNPELSPSDEAAHYDYVVRILNGSIPRLGQPLTNSTLRVVVCRGTALHGVVTPPCAQRVLQPAEFGGGGLSYEAQQPPGYYAVTALVGLIPRGLFGVGTFTASRVVGALWLISALMLLWMAGRLYGITAASIGSGCLLIAVTPVAIYSSSTVTNDAASLFCGAFLLFLSGIFLRKRHSWLPAAFFVAGLIVPLFKATDSLAAVVLSAYLLVMAAQVHLRKGWRRADMVSTFRSWLPNGGVLLLGTSISVAGWALVQRKLSLVDPKTLSTFNVLRGKPIGISTLATEAISMLGPLTNSYAALLSSSAAKPVGNASALNLIQVFDAGVLFLLVGAALAILFATPRNRFHWIGFLSITGLFFGGIALGCVLWKTYNIDPSLSGRYGLALAPFLVIAAVGLLQGRLPKAAIWAAGSVGLILDLWVMLGPT